MGTYSAHPPGDTVPITLTSLSQRHCTITPNTFIQMLPSQHTTLQEGSDLCTSQGSWCLGSLSRGLLGPLPVEEQRQGRYQGAKPSAVAVM